MYQKVNNYAFIDSQNLTLAIKDLGRRMDWLKFQKYLNDKHRVIRVYLNKLEMLVAPNEKKYSKFLKHASKTKITFVNRLKSKLEYKNEKPPKESHKP